MKLKNIISYAIIVTLTLMILFSPQKVTAKYENRTSQNLIYLTFDDGPSDDVTNEILDILKSQNVKATFFVIGYKLDGRETILKRMKNEGHSIGLHTFTHDYAKIYKNSDSFINEMNESAKSIKNILGFSPRIIRFPSGSKGHMDEDLFNKLHCLGYKIFDWNICLSDGLDHNTPVNKLYNQGTEKCINPNRVFLLAHCSGNNQNTCNALPKIIEHYKSLGYKFMPITENTPEYHFRVSK
ncbi:MAG: polysaccharide deacetylase [Clostridium sp.]|jgi:peptidoglycan/xylan/chitin deacetylase (PgdA/CDA1 family)|uniref:polysaccharide deacetylase family protein n=1 Tax=Clostridium sp. TaxID=1506 RepID=UPI0025C671CC|nr:polysaccharide deacetylase family protein [Clostridium sp.]MCH3963095.1 polysaccharide deacetylase [Clostridium sp.]MCI1716442.1 polysaccharide deacetylase [Clostridium sp.]MCI1800782.1 polysaccharide deacetylase [Clostridium sp.]MCI1814563.1 polysaccharide deacetylase [Clostridium sp.]MCI1871473.1 polysaccharide deacetylase [Clostridium sp.]